MSEEVKIKISQPMFEVGELERFDSNIHSIVEEYSKMQVHEKDQILTQRIIMKQEEEIKQLKDQLQQKENIIKEVREWLNKTIFYFDFEKDVTSHTFELLYTAQGQELLNILDKGE